MSSGDAWRASMSVDSNVRNQRAKLIKLKNEELEREAQEARGTQARLRSEFYQRMEARSA